MNPTLPTTNALSSSHVPSVSLFAQLLASERLTVRVDGTLTTAAFVPEKRILLLPSWSGFDEASWLLFVAHEVGHALFTPANGLTSHPDWQRLTQAHGVDIVRNVTNIFEDIRIERLVREKYRGLSGTFGRGYHSLITRGFFGFQPAELTSEAWASKTTLDRINLYAKAGALLRVSLSESQEIAWYNRALRLDTYEGVLALVEEVILALNAQQKAQASQASQGQLQGQPTQGRPSTEPQNGQPQNGPDGQSPDGQSPDGQDGQSADAQDPQNGQDGQSQDGQSADAQNGQSQNGQSQDDASQDGQSSNAEGPLSQSSNGPATGSNPFEVASAQSAEQQLHRAAKHGRWESTQVMLPSNTAYLHHNDVTVEQMLAKWEAPAEIRELFRQTMATQRREQSAILASMISAFRANQAAWQSRRVQISKSGTIDTAKLAQYKLVDDLFLRRQSLPEAQNHGFVIHVDWSGSMDSKMSTVLWQVLHLIWFAESIKVPVSVYGFANAGTQTEAYAEYRKTCAVSPSAGRLLELYRSSASAPVKQEAQAFLFSLVLRFAGMAAAVKYGTAGYRDTVSDLCARVPKSLVPAATSLAQTLSTHVSSDPQWLTQTFYHDYVHLGGTPLHFALFSSVDTVRKFRQAHRIEQCISVWLTDGEDTDGLPQADGSIHKNDAAEAQYDATLSRQRHADVLVDPRSGRVFKPQSGHMLATMFELHRTLTGATVVCIDITPSPLYSLSRVLPKGDLAVIANQVGDQDVVRYGRRRRARVYVKPKTLTQNRKRVILPQADGTFTETGLLLVTRKQYPQIGCDAYLVSHPEWWVKADVSTKSVSAATDVLSRSNAIVDDDDLPMTEEERTAAAQRAPVRLKAALLEQHATIAMRRFTDLLVPYMAAGRDDASVR